MVGNNRNVCKAFKDSRERCIGCMGVCDEAFTGALYAGWGRLPCCRGLGEACRGIRIGETVRA